MRALREHKNRTGLLLQPELAKKLVEGARASKPSSSGNDAGLALVRVQYAATAEPIGSMPPIPSVRAHTGEVPLSLFLDKLGERLAFERSGVRLYDALLSKLDAFGSWKNGPTRADLEHIQSEERAHFLLLYQTIIDLGGDPTVVTPSANLHGVASQGLISVLSDPRATLSQGLEAILVAELVDNDCWRTLADLAAARGETELADQFEQAISEESEHLLKVRAWLAVALGGMAERASRRTSTPGASRRKVTARPKTRAKAAARGSTARGGRRGSKRAKKARSASASKRRRA
jgi:rubrerythrin